MNALVNPLMPQQMPFPQQQNPLMSLASNPLFALGTQLLSNSQPGPTYRPMFQGVPQAMAMAGQQGMLMQQFERQKEEDAYTRSERARKAAERERRTQGLQGLNPLDPEDLGRQLMATGDPKLAIEGLKILTEQGKTGRKPVMVMGPNGQPTYVPESEAYGKPAVVPGMLPKTPEQMAQARELAMARGGGFAPNFQALPTQAGYVGYDTRRNAVTPLAFPDGTPLVRATDDPNLQGQIAGARKDEQEEAKRLATLKAEAPKAMAGLRNAHATADRVLADVARAAEKTGFWTSGFGAEWLSGWGGTPARDLKAALTTIKANLGFAELQKMRDASPTGGALGQVAVQELDSLQASVASLDQAQSAEELKAGLARVAAHLQNWKQAASQAYQERFGSAEGNAFQGPAGGAAPGGSVIDQADAILRGR